MIRPNDVSKIHAPRLPRMRGDDPSEFGMLLGTLMFAPHARG